MILKSDVLDILFENRNKAYGAYTLRKFYPGRVRTALLILLLPVVIFCTYGLMQGKGGTSIIFNVMEQTMLTGVQIEKTQPREQKKISPASSTRSNSNKYVSNIKVVGEKDSTDNLMVDALHFNAGSITYTGGADEPGEGITGTGSVPAETITENVVDADPNIPVESADVQPQYPGGMQALRAFLERHLTKPAEMDEGEIVSVKIKFIVGYDGALKGFEPVESGGEAYTNEVVRVLKKMPHWIPGKDNGKNISVYHIIPVKFISAD